jgi:hypothetical protein
MATALAQEGYSDFASGVPIKLPPTRARRRRPALPAAKDAATSRFALAAG